MSAPLAQPSLGNVAVTTPASTATTSSICPLTDAAVPLQALREYGRKEFVEILNSMRGSKALVLDPKFAGPLGLVVEPALLKDHGVVSFHYLLPQELNDDSRGHPSESRNVLFLVRPTLDNMRNIVRVVEAHRRKSISKDYGIYFVPQRTVICERFLEEQGIIGTNICLGEYKLDLIPFDNDLMSMELEGSFRECFLEGDRTCLYYVARALMKMQHLYGVIPNIRGKGECSKLVADMLLRMRREQAGDEPNLVSEIDTLVLIDRDVDLVSPMCTQLTYEGLVDEVFTIRNSVLEVDSDAGIVPSDDGPVAASTVAAAPPPVKKHKIPLNSNDKLFSEIRDMYFSIIGKEIKKWASKLSQEVEERHQAKTMAQIRDYTKRLQNITQEKKLLTIHTNLAERISNIITDGGIRRNVEAEQGLLLDADLANDYIEDLINRQEPLTKVLRLLCLRSLVTNGLKLRDLDFFRREIVQTYGFEAILTLYNLEKLGMLKKNETKSNWSQIRKSFNLIVEDINENDPNDIAYTYCMYAPLSVRLVQSAVSLRMPAWRNIQEPLRLLPGPQFDIRQPIDVSSSSVASNNVSSSGVALPPPPPPIVGGNTTARTALVFFIGGCTYAEIAALRFLSQMSGEGQREFVIGTTKLINGNTLIESVTERIENKYAAGSLFMEPFQ